MLALLVAAAAAAALPAGSHAASEAGGPLRQASTPGQDSQECGFLLLPELVQLSPTPPSSIERYGAWETTDSASLATWQQPLLRWSADTEYYFIGPRLFMKVQQEGLDDDFPGTTAVTLRDCTNQLMYTLRADLDTPGVYRVYNRVGELVARSSYSNPSDAVYKDQLEFFDSYGKAIAVAHSPAIPGPGFEHYHMMSAKQRAQSSYGDITPWQVLFFSQAETNSSLIIAQNRFVVTAVVQDMALRDSPPPDLRMWFVTLCAIPFALAAFLLYTALVSVYHVAYPSPRKPSELANPFLKDFQAYGALGSRSEQIQEAAPAGPAAQEVFEEDLYRWGN